MFADFKIMRTFVAQQRTKHFMSYIKTFEKNGKTYKYIDAVSIVKESEKAICLKVNVRFNDNEPKPRDLWFPKSVIARDGELYGAADWFYEKTANANAFHGYRMQFDATLFEA